MTTSALDQVVARVENAKRSGDGFIARCPSHDDRSPSLSVGRGTDRAVLLSCFAGCPPESIVRALGLDPAVILSARADGSAPAVHTAWRAQRAQPSGCMITPLARAKGLPEGFLRETFGLRDAIGRRAVEIPYRESDGHEVYPRRRVALGGKRHTLQPAGTRLMLYGLEDLTQWQAADAPLIFEGESDRWTTKLHGYEALTVPGASAAGVILSEHVSGVARIYVHQEPDGGGTACYVGIRKRLDALGWEGELYAFALMLNGQRVKDANALHRAVGGDRDAFRAALAASLADAVLVDLAADEPIAVWDDDDDDELAAARARIAQLEHENAELRQRQVLGGDGQETCLNCQEQRRIEQFRRDGPFRPNNAAVILQLLTTTRAARANGTPRVKLLRDDIARLVHVSVSEVTHAYQAYERFQEDPAFAAELPFRLVRWTDERGHPRVDLEVVPTAEPLTTAGACLAMMRWPNERRKPGGRQEKALPPSACPCGGRNVATQTVCDRCGTVRHRRPPRLPVQHDTPLLTPSEPSVQIGGDAYSVLVSGQENPSSNLLLGFSDPSYVLERSNLLLGSGDEVNGTIPATFTSRADQEEAKARPWRDQESERSDDRALSGLPPQPQTPGVPRGAGGPDPSLAADDRGPTAPVPERLCPTDAAVDPGGAVPPGPAPADAPGGSRTANGQGLRGDWAPDLLPHAGDSRGGVGEPSAGVLKRASAWRCHRCGAYERVIRPDGSWRCQGYGHEGRESGPAAVAGGSE